MNVKKSKLTAEIKVNRCSNLSHFVLSLDLIKASVRFDDIVEFENHEKFICLNTLYFKICSAILA